MEILSVDLGTSNTVAVLSAHGRAPTVLPLDGALAMPSAVFAPEAGDLVVGREAVRRARADPARYEPTPKRRIDEGTLLLGSRVVPVTDALAALLGRITAEVSRQLGGRLPDRIRLTHPAQWGPVRRNTLLSAARQAGMGNVVLVPEPIAAAAHFASFPGRGLGPGQALAVYDLGAGTFDVGIVGVNQQGFVVLAEAGLPDLGGLDVDQALLDHVGRQVGPRDPQAWHGLSHPQQVADRRASRTLREDITSAKEALSAHPQTEIAMPAPFEDVLVTRAELESLIRPNLVRSVELLLATVRAAGLTPDRLAGVYLVGGSSRIPLVGKLITEGLRVVPTSLDMPESTVALGAHQVPEVVRTPQTAQVSQVSQPLLVGAPPTGGFAQPQVVRPPLPPAASPVPPPRKQASPWVAAVVALAVFAILAVAAIFVVRGLAGPGGPSVADCTGQPNPDKVANCVQALYAPLGATHTCGPGYSGQWVCTPKNAATDPKIVFATYANAADTSRYIEMDLGNRIDAGAAPTPVPWSSRGVGGNYWLYSHMAMAAAEITEEGMGFTLIASLDQANMSVKIEFDLTMQMSLDVAGRKQLVTDYFLTKVAPKG